MTAAEKAFIPAHSLRKWNRELNTLDSTPVLTKKQRVRCADLRSAIDSCDEQSAFRSPMEHGDVLIDATGVFIVNGHENGATSGHV